MSRESYGGESGTAQSYYEILGVSQNANQEKISRAFKKLSKKYHPDLGGNLEIYQGISEAYATLKDPDKRRTYDKKVGNRVPFQNVSRGGRPRRGSPNVSQNKSETQNGWSKEKEDWTENGKYTFDEWMRQTTPEQRRKRWEWKEKRESDLYGDWVTIDSDSYEEWARQTPEQREYRARERFWYQQGKEKREQHRRQSEKLEKEWEEKNRSQKPTIQK